MFNLANKENKGPIIKVVGVGGAGRNALTHMLEKNIMGAEYICVNTDVQSLIRCDSDTPVEVRQRYEAVTNIELGQGSNRGLGAGANPEVARQAANESREQIIDVIQDADLIFIAAGMGGGTGTGAAPVIAQFAKELDVLAVAVVSTPFEFEGGKRPKNTEYGLEELTQHTDSLIVIDNDKLNDIDGDGLLLSSFEAANNVLANAVQCITELVTRPGMINVDFADLKSVMSEKGMAIMGSGVASGEGRDEVAVDDALNFPLINQVDLSQAKGLLVNVTAGKNLKISEYSKVMKRLNESTDSETNIIGGLLIDDTMEDELRVSVIATGLQYNRNDRKKVRSFSPYGESPRIFKQRNAVHSGYGDNQKERADGAGSIKRNVSVKSAGKKEKIVSVPPILGGMAD